MERQHFPSDLILIVPRTNNADEIHTEDESTAQSALEQIMSYNNQDGFDDEQSSGAVLDFPNDGYNNTVNTSNGLHHRSYSRSPSPILPSSSSSSRHDDDSYNDSYTNQHSYSPPSPYEHSDHPGYDRSYRRGYDQSNFTDTHQTRQMQTRSSAGTSSSSRLSE